MRVSLENTKYKVLGALVQSWEYSQIQFNEIYGTTFRRFHQLYMRAFFVLTLFRQLFTCTRNVHVTRKKLPKWCSYEIFVRKMLMKLTPVGICSCLTVKAL